MTIWDFISQHPWWTLIFLLILWECAVDVAKARRGR